MCPNNEENCRPKQGESQKSSLWCKLGGYYLLVGSNLFLEVWSRWHRRRTVKRSLQHRFQKEQHVLRLVLHKVHRSCTYWIKQVLVMLGQPEYLQAGCPHKPLLSLGHHPSGAPKAGSRLGCRSRCPWVHTGQLLSPLYWSKLSESKFVKKYWIIIFGYCSAESSVWALIFLFPDKELFLLPRTGSLLEDWGWIFISVKGMENSCPFHGSQFTSWEKTTEFLLLKVPRPGARSLQLPTSNTRFITHSSRNKTKQCWGIIISKLNWFLTDSEQMLFFSVGLFKCMELCTFLNAFLDQNPEMIFFWLTWWSPICLHSSTWKWLVMICSVVSQQAEMFQCIFGCCYKTKLFHSALYWHFHLY